MRGEREQRGVRQPGEACEVERVQRGGRVRRQHNQRRVGVLRARVQPQLGEAAVCLHDGAERDVVDARQPREVERDELAAARREREHAGAVDLLAAGERQPPQPGQRSESASAEDDVTCFIQYSEQCSSARPQRSAASLTPASVTAVAAVERQRAERRSEVLKMSVAKAGAKGEVELGERAKSRVERRAREKFQRGGVARREVERPPGVAAERRAGAAEPAEVESAKMAVGAGVERAAEVFGGRNRLGAEHDVLHRASSRETDRRDGDCGRPRSQPSMNGAPVELSVCIGGAPLRTHSLPPGEFGVAQPGSAFTIKLKNVWHVRISVELKVDGQGSGATRS